MRTRHVPAPTPRWPATRRRSTVATGFGKRQGKDQQRDASRQVVAPFLLPGDGGDRQEEPGQQTPGVAEEDSGWVKVVGEKADDGPDQRYEHARGRVPLRVR